METNLRSRIADTGTVVLMGQTILLGCLLLWFLARGIAPRYEILAAALIIIPIWHKSRHRLLGGLLPFLMILLTFESLRGFGDGVRIADIHITDVITLEKALFNGIVPAYYLQSTLMGGAWGQILIYATSLLYASHYFVPLFMASFLWYRHRTYFWPFVLGFIIMTYCGFVIYLLFPAAPPWWATQHGYLLDQPVNLPTQFLNMAALAEDIGPNEVAAMPSLHMSFPTFVTLFCLYIWGKRAAWVGALPLAIGFATIYLGHHYVIDLIAGALLASLVFAAVQASRDNRLSNMTAAWQFRSGHLAKGGLQELVY